MKTEIMTAEFIKNSNMKTTAVYAVVFDFDIPI